MEENPALFKGFGKLQPKFQTVRKIFPHLRNKSQLETSHHQTVDFQTSNKKFSLNSPYPKPIRYRPVDKFRISYLETIPSLSETHSKYPSYQQSQRRSPYRENQQGTGIFQYEARTGDKVIRNVSVSRNSFSDKTQTKDNNDFSYPYKKYEKLDPINGEISARESCGYQKFSTQRVKNYHAHNPNSLSKKYNIQNENILKS